MNTKEMMRLMHGQINDEKRGLFRRTLYGKAEAFCL